MSKIEIPDDVVGEIVRLIAANEDEARRERRRAQERLMRDRAAERRARQAELERVRPRAEIVVDWASELAATGLLDDLEEGILLYKQPGKWGGPRRLVVRWDGLHFERVVVISDSVITSDSLAESVPAAVVEELAELIESGGIWERIRALNLLSEAT